MNEEEKIYNECLKLVNEMEKDNEEFNKFCEKSNAEFEKNVLKPFNNYCDKLDKMQKESDQKFEKAMKKLK